MLHVFHLQLRSCSVPACWQRHTLTADLLLLLPVQPQEITGLEVTSLIEDPEHASVRQIVSEVLGSQQPGAVADASMAAAGSSAVVLQHMASPWISPAPVTVKMRLFCLPYAGGISENVYSRCAFCRGLICG